MSRFLRCALPAACALLLILRYPAHAKPSVTVWTWQPDVATVHRMIAAIELAHPNIDVQPVVQPGATYFAALDQAAAAGTLPDIIALPPGAATQEFRDQLKDLSNPADGEIGKDWKKHFIQGALANAQLGNPKGNHGYYLLPMSMQLDGVWINLQAFNKAKLAAPKTFADMAADSAQLRQVDVTPMVLGEAAEQAAPALFFELLARTDAAELENAAQGRAIWTQPGVVRAAQAWHQLFTAGILSPKDLDSDPQQEIAAFQQGKAAMIVAGSRWLGDAGKSGLSSYACLGFPPIAAGGKAAPPVGGVDLGWAITLNGTGTQGEQEAVESVWRELVVGVGAQQAANALAGIPAYKDLRPQGNLGPPAQHLYDLFRTRLESAKPDRVGNPAIAHALLVHLRAVATGAETPGQAMHAVDAVAEQQARLNG